MQCTSLSRKHSANIQFTVFKEINSILVFINLQTKYILDYLKMRIKFNTSLNIILYP